MQSDFRQGGFKTLPTIVKNLLIINGLVWLAQITIEEKVFPIEDTFALHYIKSVFYKPWQVVTYMFMHSPQNFFHILFNMFALWMFGSTLENLWGAKRFLIFYLLCGIGAAFVHMIALGYDVSKLADLYSQGQISDETFYGNMNIPTMGASGAVMGIFAAFAYTFPNSQMLILPIPFPIKAKWALLGMVVLDLFGGVSNQQSGIAHFAHLGGAAVGIILVMIWNKKNRKTFY
jgi:membrane associated rhomboid family serine protease